VDERVRGWQIEVPMDFRTVMGAITMTDGTAPARHPTVTRS
jgi:hypothetical protein